MQPAEFRPAQNYDTNPYYDNAEWPGPGYVIVEPLDVTENDTYTAPDGKAYSPVTVNVSGGGGEIPMPQETTFIVFCDYESENPILVDYTILYNGNPIGGGYAQTVVMPVNWTISMSFDFEVYSASMKIDGGEAQSLDVDYDSQEGISTVELIVPGNVEDSIVIYFEMD